MNVHRRPADFASVDANASLIWLLGQPHLEEYLSFVARKVVGGEDIPTFQLAEEWRAANDHYYALEQTEAGDADRIKTRALPKSVTNLADEVRADRYYEAIFDTLPTTIEMVEIDRFVMWQGQVADRFATLRGEMLGRTPTPDALFRFCLPLQRDLPPVSIRRLSADRYQFVSDATDFGAQTPQFLPEALLDTLKATGPLAAALTIPIGFGANFLSAIRSDDRLLLHNGYHRAYALRALGIRYAPCIVQTVTRRDELKYAADPRVTGDPAFYFRASRPPLLRDFFDPKLAKRLHVLPIQTVVDIQVSVTSCSSTALPLRPQG